MLTAQTTIAIASLLLAAVPPAGHSPPAAPQSCSSAEASGGSDAGGGQCGGAQSCSSGQVSRLEKLRSFPDSVWEEARRDVGVEDEISKVEAEAFGPRPPSDPKEYAEALATLLAKPTGGLFGFAAHKSAVPVENVGAEAKLGEASVRMASLQVEEPIDAVFGFYAKSLEAQGLRANSSMVGENGAYFSFRASDGFLRTLTLVEIDGTTMVLVAVGDPTKVRQGAAAFISDWPMLPVAEDPLDLSQAEGASLQLNRYARVRSTGKEEVVNFYKRELPPLGWKFEPSANVAGADVRVAAFSRGEQKCTVVVSDGDDQTCLMNAMCIVRR